MGLLRHGAVGTADAQERISRRGSSIKSKGKETRERLLDAARRVFAVGGFHGSSIVDITQRAGTSVGTFYVYFKNKDDVLREIVADVAGRLQRAMTALGCDTPEARVVAYIRFLGEHPEAERIVNASEVIQQNICQSYYRVLADCFSAEAASDDPVEIARWVHRVLQIHRRQKDAATA